jgi:hypothetical protein
MVPVASVLDWTFAEGRAVSLTVYIMHLAVSIMHFGARRALGYPGDGNGRSGHPEVQAVPGVHVHGICHASGGLANHAMHALPAVHTVFAMRRYEWCA